MKYYGANEIMDKHDVWLDPKRKLLDIKKLERYIKFVFNV